MKQSWTFSYPPLEDFISVQQPPTIQDETLQVAIVTSDFPGSFTMVSRPAKGPALTFNWMVCQHCKSHRDESLAGEREGDGGDLHRRDQHGHLLLQAHP